MESYKSSEIACNKLVNWTIYVWKQQGADQRQSTKVTHDQLCWSCFSSVYKGYHFALLIFYLTLSRYQLWSWRQIKNRCCRSFCNLSLFIEQWVWIYVWNNVHKIFLVICFLEESWKKETWIFLAIAYCSYLICFCKYLFTLSLDSPFLLYNLFCILGKWLHKLNYCFHS